MIFIRSNLCGENIITVQEYILTKWTTGSCSSGILPILVLLMKFYTTEITRAQMIFKNGSQLQ